MMLYLDDERETPEGWERAYSIDEAKTMLLTRKVTHLSVDNDLGSEDHTTEGYNLIDWLERIIFNNRTFPLPEITIHSSNLSRVDYMERGVESIKKIRERQINGEL